MCNPFTVVTPGSRIREPVLFLTCLRGPFNHGHEDMGLNLANEGFYSRWEQ